MSDRTPPTLLPGADLARRIRHRWTLIEAGATAVGAFVVAIVMRTIHDAPSFSDHAEQIVLVLYLGIGIPAMWLWRERRTRVVWRWLQSNRAPNASERNLVLREPLRETQIQATFWLVAAVVDSFLMLSASLQHALEMTLAIVLGGVTTCALTYLLVERLLRPLKARALGVEPPARPVGPGVRHQLIMAWALASGVPLLGLVLLGLRALHGGLENPDPDALAVSVMILAGVGLFAGAVAAVLAARSLADPLGEVRRALARVHAGDFDVEVPVDDGSEIGLLQAGFNELTSGLREREQLRDLFGRHVGEEVARRALAEGVSLGGEVREVAALFVDIVGSTALASDCPPGDVVAQLNRFFAVVVDAVEGHGGWVNKFEGDGALCVFGAPVALPDMTTRALAAARVLHRRLCEEVPELDAGIGVSAGCAVAGNVGSERRLEYTVVGDPVNEAARLCELAKAEPGRVLASTSVVANASASEAGNWSLGEEVMLRGRSTPTRLASPALDRTHEEVPTW